MDEPIDPLKEAQKRYERSEKGKERSRRYREKNKEKIREYRRKWYVEKMASDPEFAEKEQERIRKAFARHYQKKQMEK